MNYSTHVGQMHDHNHEFMKMISNFDDESRRVTVFANNEIFYKT